jgi:hypothetical protein
MDYNMKYVFIIIFSFLFIHLVNSQENTLMLQQALSQMKDGSYEGIILNNNLVEVYLIEYIDEAKKRGILISSHINNLNWILIEPESNIPNQLTGYNLGKVDKEKNLILLSRACLLDSNILKETLFREISHYLGVPYQNDCFGIMTVNKPDGYSYSWMSDNEIIEIEYDRMFELLKKILNK